MLSSLPPSGKIDVDEMHRALTKSMAIFESTVSKELERISNEPVQGDKFRAFFEPIDRAFSDFVSLNRSLHLLATLHPVLFTSLISFLFSFF